MKLPKRRSPMTWRTRWYRCRNWLRWWCWDKWRGRPRWRTATFAITDKEIAENQPTGVSPGGWCGRCRRYHPPFDHDAARKEHMDAAVKAIADDIDAKLIADFVRERGVDEAVDILRPDRPPIQDWAKDEVDEGMKIDRALREERD